MRKLVFSLAGVIAVLALTASLAVGASHGPRGHVSAVKCGGLYQPPCIKPVVIARSAVACQNTGTTLRFPVAVRANAGLKSATAKFRGKTIKTVKFKGSPTNGSFTVVVHTQGLRPSIFTLTIKATDTRNVSASRNVHFTICKPKPVFTG